MVALFTEIEIEISVSVFRSSEICRYVDRWIDSGGKGRWGGRLVGDPEGVA